MKNSKGITLISLIVIIVVLLILAGVVTTAGIGLYHNAQFTAFTAELKIMQTEVNELYDMHTKNETINIDGTETEIIEIGEELSSNQIEHIKQILNTEDVSGYRLYTVEIINDILNIENITREFFVNVEKRNVISVEGLEYDGNIYYTLEEIPNSGYNVEYSVPSYDPPTFSYKNNEGEVDIGDIEYDGYIDKWYIEYKKVGEDNWTKTESHNISIEDAGEYNLRSGNGDIYYSNEVIFTVVNKPILEDNMIKVYWDESGNEIKSENDDGTINTEFDNSKWYNYRNTATVDPKNTSQWANAITEDGSYWVWIPKYEYKITYNNSLNKSYGGTIDLNFISADVTTPTEGYTIHPSFTAAESGNYDNGEWDTERAGFWISKYEMSGTVDNLKSIPNVSSLTDKNIGEMYTAAQNMTVVDGYMARNSEWGAVAYLTHSRYGRNGEYVSRNSTNINGEGGNNASTTGNYFGIFDMNGNSREYVASYIANGSVNLNTYGSSFANNTVSTKYYTAYSYNSYNNSGSSNYYKNTDRIGDAIYETSSNGDSNNGSWGGAYAYYPRYDNPFFDRGGASWDSRSGIFFFDDVQGHPHCAFRVCIEN